MKKIIFPLLMLSASFHPLRFKPENLNHRNAGEFRASTKCFPAKKQYPIIKVRCIIAGTADGF